MPPNLETFIEAATREIARSIADIRREQALHDAQWKLRLVELNAQFHARLAELKDGEPGIKGEQGERGLQGERGEDGVSIRGEQGERGLQGERGEQGEPGVSMRGERGLQGERGEQGEQGAPGENGKNGEPGIKGERGERGPVGMLPIVRAWEDHVYYVGDVVHYAGSTYQAVRDTGRAPSFDDWALLAMRGMDGVNGTNGRSLHHCGTYSVDAEYEALDVVILNGASFVAKQNKPGECPGDGWQLMAQKGERGNKGERGVKGDRGERGLTGATVASINCDLEGLLTMTMSDGSKVVCDLYPVLSRIGVA